LRITGSLLLGLLYNAPLTSITRGHPSGAANQARALREEGVEVSTGSLGEFVVDFSRYGWFPHQLPSEAAAGLAPHDDPDGEDA
jgi:methylated-DNA-protein-cysteine methyltransferase-like protein